MPMARYQEPNKRFGMTESANGSMEIVIMIERSWSQNKKAEDLLVGKSSAST